ncbi:MAG: CHRD domain-containing protein [Verrucomicrobiae bacterium]|nr:CHRD domain-containing protein [Verrucomicrobiae bacterium]
MKCLQLLQRAHLFPLFFILTGVSAKAQQVTTFGVPTADLTELSGVADAWDLTVVVTQPIAPGDDAEGQVNGTVHSWNYYAADDGRDVTEYTVRPLLVQNEDDVFSVIGIGAVHHPEEPGLQDGVAFGLEDGTDAFNLEDESVTYHIAFIGQRPDFGNDDSGGIIPFAADGGPGMFAMNTLPDTEFLIGDALTSAHASPEGGRNYLFNFDINWGGDPIDPDPDNDGMRTTWEERYGLDPEDPSDAATDLDKDGLSNLREFEAGLTPNQADTDEDGRGDAVELGAIVLSSDQSTPAPALGDASPYGFAFVTVDPDTRTVEIEGSYFGMTSDVSAAHLHGPAAPGATAGVVFGLTASGGTEGTLTGSGVLSEANFASFVSGQTYINVHTANNGGGEIRGQVPVKIDLTDPKNPDSDDDGLLDGVESNSGVFVSETDPGTDPNKADTDDDGYSDRSEITKGTDPTDPLSKPEELGSFPEFGADDWADGIGVPDGWDLTVVLTTPIAPPADFAGESMGIVEYINYYFAESRPVGDHTVAPVLVKHIEDTDEYLVAGVGETHVADATGAQAKVPFVPVTGSNVIDLTEAGVTWHVAAYQGHPGAANNTNGAVIPYADSGGEGMFAYDNGPDEELSEGLALTSGHASEEGGRHYAFNFGINWTPGGEAPFTITEVSHAATGVTLSWNSRDGREYSVEYREDLADGVWIELDDGVAANGETTTFTDSDAARTGLPRGYYRIKEN